MSAANENHLEAAEEETAGESGAQSGHRVVPLNGGTETAPEAPRRRRWRRYVLMFSLPVLIAAAGGYFWITGGRFMATDNAYVQQRMVVLSTDVSGRIVEVDAEENAPVNAGDVIFKLDPAPYRIALQQAEAALANARLQVDQMRAAYQGALADLESARETVDFHQTAFDRQQALARNGYATQARLDEVEHELKDARQDVASAEQDVASKLAMLGGDVSIKTEDHPQVLRATAERDKAALDLEHTVVRAPADGIVTQTDRLTVGQFVSAATTVATLVETDNVWIEANFKETDLTHMSVGQSATVSIDAYPDEEFTGTVSSIGAGTGSEFALLPAQNATGNWVKVVQRVPVRITVGPGAPANIRTGMSAEVSVDTRHQRPLPALVEDILDLTGTSAFAAVRE
ncbi:HlyD family secretion protein [Microbaculum marinum]|uniref:HlyD family secretion protein n=1 Tax=Microbaculum marinum TaxID=1764581 RepID=A0AAW9RA93_9HYPH